MFVAVKAGTAKVGYFLLAYRLWTGCFFERVFPAESFRKRLRSFVRVR
jgi:hypothetical protein